MTTLEETVMDLRKEIEKLLPHGWQVWARLDICDFQFFGWYNSITNCVKSPCYTTEIPDAKEVARFMLVSLETMERLKKKRT